MGMSMAGGGGGRRRRGMAGGRVMSEINVTPLVDVMLVLLIIFMVAAPLMTTVIDVNLPQAGGGAMPQATSAEPLQLALRKTGGSCSSKTDVLLGDNTPVPASELEARLKAIGETRAEADRVIFLNADRDACVSEMAKMLGIIRSAGLKANIVIRPEEGK